jgi:hypothetical protein
MGQHPLGRRPLCVVLQTAFDHLDVEAAELVPGEIVQRAGRVGVAVVSRQSVTCPVTVASRLRIQRSSTPGRRQHRCRLEAFEVHQGEPRGVPQLVAEVAAQLEPFADHRAAGQGLVLRLLGPLRGKLLAALWGTSTRGSAVLLRLLDQWASQCGHSNCTGIRTSCDSVVM